MHCTCPCSLTDTAPPLICTLSLHDALPICSSDHAPYRYDETGKLTKGERTTFKDTANGVPGIELRVPLLFTYGYRARSEEHTSELQSRLHLVCRLLLEKKKQKSTRPYIYTA